MALEVWYKSDIQNALRAAEMANGAALNAADRESDPYVTGYQAGYRAALTTLALAFGLSVVSSVVGRPVMDVHNDGEHVIDLSG